MKNNHIIANIQPSFTATDLSWVKRRITEEVQPWSYCWKTMMKMGIFCAGGSDAPIETCEPLIGIYDAIIRKSHEDKKSALNNGESSSSKNDDEKVEDLDTAFEREPFLPNECLSFSEALWLYTIGGAYACKQENKIGQLEPGYYADFIAFNIPESSSLDTDPQSHRISELFPRDLLQIEMSYVWINGKLVYNQNEEIRDLDVKSDDIGGGINLGGPYIPGKNGQPGALLEKMRGILVERSHGSLNEKIVRKHKCCLHH